MSMKINKLFYDIESTSKDAAIAEVIEAYFELVDSKKTIIDTYHFKSRVNKWSDEAAEVHGITYYEMSQYPKKEKAYDDLFEWLDQYKGTYTPVLFANTNNYGEHYAYDNAVFKMQILELFGSHTLFYEYFSDDYENVWEMAHDAHRKNIFIVHKSKTLTQFSQENVYKNLFNGSYKAHRASDDVKAMTKIYYELQQRLYFKQGLLV